MDETLDPFDPQVTSPPLTATQNEAVIDVQISQVNGQRFRLDVVWDTVNEPKQFEDGPSQLQDSGQNRTFKNVYTTNPQEDNPAADILVIVEMNGLADGTIELVQGGTNLLDDPRFSETVIIPVLNLRIGLPEVLPVAEALPPVFAHADGRGEL